MQRVDLSALRSKYSDLSNVISSCPLSKATLFETIELGSCMCLSFEIERPQGYLNDPYLIQVKKVVPKFYSSEAFIDSQIFKLEDSKDSEET